MRLVKFLRLYDLHFDWKAVVAIISTTLILIVDYYHPGITNPDLQNLLLYFFIPLGIILLVFRDKPGEYGFRIGDWKAGLLITFIACLGITGVMFFLARTGPFENYYDSNATPWQIFRSTAIEMVGWEFFFRGFLLFSLYRIAGANALFLQAVPFSLAHLSKPEVETLSTIFGGAAFGYVAWRTKSFVYPFLIHTYLATLTVLLANAG
jgi:membrane protease YdiL (CAAX protease family)